LLVSTAMAAITPAKPDCRRFLKLAEQSNAMIYTIGASTKTIRSQCGRSLAWRGRPADKLSSPGQLNEVEICQSIARDIRNQYAIGYVSTNTTRNGAYGPPRGRPDEGP
jgi:hypothetical protein